MAELCFGVDSSFTCCPPCVSLWQKPPSLVPFKPRGTSSHEFDQCSGRVVSCLLSQKVVLTKNRSASTATSVVAHVMFCFHRPTLSFTKPKWNWTTRSCAPFSSKSLQRCRSSSHDHVMISLHGLKLDQGRSLASPALSPPIPFSSFPDVPPPSSSLRRSCPHKRQKSTSFVPSIGAARRVTLMLGPIFRIAVATSATGSPHRLATRQCKRFLDHFPCARPQHLFQPPRIQVSSLVVTHGLPLVNCSVPGKAAQTCCPSLRTTV